MHKLYFSLNLRVANIKANFSEKTVTKIQYLQIMAKRNRTICRNLKAQMKIIKCKALLFWETCMS